MENPMKLNYEQVKTLNEVAKENFLRFFENKFCGFEKSLYICSPFRKRRKFIERIGRKQVQASTDFNTIKIRKSRALILL